MIDKNELLSDPDGISVTLDLENGSVECSVVTVFTAQGKDYIALLPETGPDAESGSVYLYRYSVDDAGEPLLGYIDDDEEYETASDAFDEYLDSAEFDELVTEDDIDPDTDFS